MERLEIAEVQVPDFEEIAREFVRNILTQKEKMDSRRKENFATSSKWIQEERSDAKDRRSVILHCHFFVRLFSVDISTKRNDGSVLLTKSTPSTVPR